MDYSGNREQADHRRDESLAAPPRSFDGDCADSCSGGGQRRCNTAARHGPNGAQGGGGPGAARARTGPPPQARFLGPRSARMPADQTDPPVAARGRELVVGQHAVQGPIRAQGRADGACLDGASGHYQNPQRGRPALHVLSQGLVASHHGGRTISGGAAGSGPGGRPFPCGGHGSAAGHRGLASPLVGGNRNLGRRLYGPGPPLGEPSGSRSGPGGSDGRQARPRSAAIPSASQPAIRAVPPQGARNVSPH